MKLLQDKNRLKFFVSHLTLSVVVIGIFLAVVLLLWYPSPLAWAMGVLPILGMLALIDVFVGPIFGFLVYKTGKKTLKMDLTVIVLIQIVAFAFGAYSIAQSRPAWIVHHGNTFSVVRRVDATHEQFDEYSRPTLGSPNFVLYTAKQSLSDQLLKKPIDDTGDIRDPRFYGSFEAVTLQGLPLETLYKFNEKAQVDAVLARYPTAKSWYGLATSGIHDLVILIDEQGNRLDMVKLHPWNT